MFAWLLLGSAALGAAALGGCENLGKPREQGGNAAAPGPSAVAPGGCKALCARQAKCLQSFRALGSEPIFVAPSRTPCAKACDQTARDRLVGKPLDRVIRECAARGDCDGFYGCALRIWLSHLKRHPWKRAVLRARRRSRTVALAVQQSRSKQAMRLCRGSELFTALEALRRPEATRARQGLASACGGAVKLRLESAIQGLERWLSKLDPDAHTADCKELRSWKPPRWLPPAHVARKRIARARALCDRLDGQRKLAFAIRYAERDTQVVSRALRSGATGDTAYYKCIHKASTLKTLEGANHPRAQAAAKTLREVCFERFPVAFLSAHRSAGPRFAERHCYRVRGVAALLSGHAQSDVVKANAALLRWAAARCPVP